MNVAVLIPVRDDWEAAARLCREIPAELANSVYSAAIWLVDDGSDTPLPQHFPAGVNIISLGGRYGHQRAIAAGLSFLHRSQLAGDGVLVMDGDGEDRPADVPRLLTASLAHAGKIVVARRQQRHVSPGFRLGYFFFRHSFRMSTGQSLTFGNFLFLPAGMLPEICASPFTPRHLAATILRLGLPYLSLRVNRGKRYAGSSRMNLPALIRHGLAAFTVYLGPTPAKTATDAAAIVQGIQTAARSAAT